MDHPQNGEAEVGELFVSLDGVFGQPSEEESGYDEGVLEIQDSLAANFVVIDAVQESSEERIESTPSLPAISLFQAIGASGDGLEPDEPETASSEVALSFDPFFSEPPQYADPASADAEARSVQPTGKESMPVQTDDEPQPPDQGEKLNPAFGKPVVSEAENPKSPAPKTVKSRYADLPIAEPAGGDSPKRAASTENDAVEPPSSSGGQSAEKHSESLSEKHAEDTGKKPVAKAAAPSVKHAGSAAARSAGEVSFQPKNAAQPDEKAAGSSSVADGEAEKKQAESGIGSSSAAEKPGHGKAVSKARSDQRPSAAVAASEQSSAPLRTGADRISEAAPAATPDRQPKAQGAALKQSSEAKAASVPGKPAASPAAAKSEQPAVSSADPESKQPVQSPAASGPGKPAVSEQSPAASEPEQPEQNAFAAAVEQRMPKTAPVPVRPAVEQNSRKDGKPAKKAAGTALVVIALALACVACAAVMFSMGSNETSKDAPVQSEDGTSGEGSGSGAEAGAGTETYRYSVTGPDGAMCQATEEAQFDEQGYLERSIIAVELASPEQAQQFIDATKVDFGEAFLVGSVEESKAIVEVEATAEDMTREAYAAVLKKNAADFELSDR